MSPLRLQWPVDHPAVDGHFPGDPIVPGALLLSEAVRLAASALGRELEAFAVASAKFPSPCRAGECVEIAFRATGSGVSLTGAVAGRTVLRAEVTCAAIFVPS